MPSKRGFASMSKERQREIASKGGKAAHAKGTAHEWSSDEAKVAGSKGGKVVSSNRQHMEHIGRKGGEARARNRQSVGAQIIEGLEQAVQYARGDKTVGRVLHEDVRVDKAGEA
jgi:general stress protein YciG